MVDRALARDAAPTKTKLVKFLYLADIARVQDRTRRLTDLDWIYFHYGPYAFELERRLDRLSGGRLEVRGRDEALLYVGAPDPPDAESWPDSTRLLLDRIVDRWAAEPLNALLDHVYFETEPMVAASRGDHLDFTLVRPPTFVRPDPGPVRSDVLKRLRDVAARRADAHRPPTPGRHDEVWEKAMRYEERLDGGPLNSLVGQTFRFTDAAARAIAEESE